MVVLAIIAILTGIAVVSVRKSSYAGTVDGFAAMVAAECTVAQQRAVASKRWQRLDIMPGSVEHWESSTEGMAPPTVWEHVRTIIAPNNVEVVAVSYKTHVVANDGVPGPGTNLDGVVNFAPDGGAMAATIFVGHLHQDKRSRVTIYRASGTAYAFNEW